MTSDSFCKIRGYEFISSAVLKILAELVSEYPNSDFGPAHIVVGDCNVDDGSIAFCLYEIITYEHGKCAIEYSDEELRATADALKAILNIPEGNRYARLWTSAIDESSMPVIYDLKIDGVDFVRADKDD